VVKLKVITLNKHISGLTVKCFEMPNASYTEPLDWKNLKNISGIDALAFGFPYNDFSVVGEQKGINGVFGPLYSYGIRALNYFKPKWFLAENVGGLRNSNEGTAFQLILKKMYEAGYSVYPHLYKFEQYGVPQARR
jgi:DNA (cytosine-5)-methyltransferase 1